MGQANPDIEQVIICNNLVIGGQIGLQGFGSTTRHLNEFAANWLISHNIWQPDSPIDSSHIALVGQGAETIELLSHDQDDPNFLRPAIGSLPTSAGKGGEFPTYVGAFPPNY